MEKEDAIDKTPSLDGPSGAVESAVGVNDLGNSTADKNNNTDGTVASPLSAAPKKRLFKSNKRQMTTSPSSFSPHKGKAKKKTKETKHSLQHGQKAPGRRNSVKSTKALKNVTNAKANERPSSPSESPMKAKNLNNLEFENSPIKTQPSKKKGGYNITSKVILQRLRPDDIFGGRAIALENVYDADDIAQHDEPFSKAANSKFGHDKISLSKVKDGYLTNDFSNLSRLLLEDVLIQCNDDNEPTLSFRVLISTPPTREQISNGNAHLSAMQTQASKIYWHQQRHGELGLHKREIMGTKYHELYATLVPNSHHRAIKEGQLTMGEIEELVNRGGEFELHFEGTSSMSDDSSNDATMKIKWRDMVEYPGDIMIFGPQSAKIRSFDRLFRNKQYFERVWAQNEQLLRNFPFSRFMESSMNRCVRIHPEATGKRMVAQDEYLELKNANLAGLPMIHKLESFIRQGQNVGLIERAS